MRIDARQATCIGSGQCVFTDFDAFDQDDSGKVLVIRPVPETVEQEALAREAAQVCPSRSILITNDEKEN